MVPTITLLLLCTFLYFGYDARWFDMVLFGNRISEINTMAEIRANVALAALVAWTMRNDLVTFWGRRDG
jgi:hypothetical protein